MKKKLYSIPQIEVVIMTGFCNVMKTSIDLLPDMAPRRRSGTGPNRTPVF